MSSDDPVDRFLRDEADEKAEQARAQAERGRIVAAFPAQADSLVSALAAEAQSAATRAPEFSVENRGPQTVTVVFRDIRLNVRPYGGLGVAPSSLKVILTRVTGDMTRDREILREEEVPLEVEGNGFSWNGYATREFAKRSIEQILEFSRRR